MRERGRGLCITINKKEPNSKNEVMATYVRENTAEHR